MNWRTRLWLRWWYNTDWFQWLIHLQIRLFWAENSTADIYCFRTCVNSFPFSSRTGLQCWATLILVLKLFNHCACLFPIDLPPPVCLTQDNTTPTWNPKPRDCIWQQKTLSSFCGFREWTSQPRRQVWSSTTLEAARKIPLLSLSQKLFSKEMSALISLPPQNS